MADIIKEPRGLNPETQDWEEALYKLTRTAGGLLLIGLTNMDNELEPKVKVGSRFEINGSFYQIGAQIGAKDEAITGSLTGNTVAYIYAVASGDTAIFTYSTDPPDFNPALGGWYSGNNRALAKFFYTGEQYNGKVILDSYNAMQVINTEQTIPTTGGVVVVTGVVNEVRSTILPAGAYRWEIKAGNGGDGGNSSAGDGGKGATGEAKSETFMLYQPTKIYYALGGDGNDGETIVRGAGGGASGGSAFIDFIYESFICLGGSGGGGAGDPGSDDWGGGGGAGGYGKGGDGANATERALGGLGGNNGVGGSGGSTDGSSDSGSGGGGSGYIEGGDAGFSDGPVGKKGGGYGEKGGDGTYVGIGGESQTGEGIATAIEKYTRRIQYQGGGAGAAGKGGSGLKSQSSGYLRIYRM
jgi:hypothetical protein